MAAGECQEEHFNRASPRKRAELGLADADLQGEPRSASGLGVSLQGESSGGPAVPTWKLSLSWAENWLQSHGGKRGGERHLLQSSIQLVASSLNKERLGSQHALPLRMEKGRFKVGMRECYTYYKQPKCMLWKSIF